ncbi:exodeoxyribonuclease VII small subunit [Adlercreutzia sp. ZJ138]|uniref:exodeoxyribonuclease VII small subunit n=1 Tax=Adlercreutzia sp. ZJ138 TaxID=2709405 RepID=UPI0013EC4CF0|nr:exodeoxyribonuclease VII small subunit [Adlercreutzia sp. ZJ138]
MANSAGETFADVQKRLDEILDAVNDEETSLDEALALCEEAVGLGLRASDMLEEDVDSAESGRSEPGNAESGSSEPDHSEPASSTAEGDAISPSEAAS